MPIPDTRSYLGQLLIDGLAVQFLPNASGDFISADPFGLPPQLVAGIGDVSADGVADLVFGAPGDDDKDVDAGRIFVLSGAISGGLTATLSAASDLMIIDGIAAGDRAGAAVGTIADLNADGKGDILIGAPGSDIGTAADAGAAYVIWGNGGSNVDLGDPFGGGGKGFVIKGQAAGDAAGTTVMSIADLNGDGKADILVGAPGQDAGGSDAGAVYVVWGKSSSSIVNLSSVAAGTGGFRIVGANAGDMAGAAIGTVSDLNGDGKSEILIGTSASQAGGLDSGAVYVVFGKGTGSAVDLDTVAAGTGGFVITGVAGDMAGASVAGVGDINGDGKADILLSAPGSDSAYVVFGKSDTAAVDLADVAAGLGGFQILSAAWGDLAGMTVAGGKDFNHDGIADIVIGAPHDSEGGVDAGAIYIVWGGAHSTVDLSLVAQSMGGAKIIGEAGSLTGASVSITADITGDGSPEILASAPGAGESAWLIQSQASWQPDANVYGTNGADVIGAGYGGAHIVGANADNVVALDGNDTISTGGGNDTIDGGAGDDAMAGGTGDDTYYVDSFGDAVSENPGEGTDTVIASVDHWLAAEVENLVLSGWGLAGTGNDLDNRITGTDGNDSLDGGAGADTLEGGAGDDTYGIDNAADVVVEAAGGGTDTVIATIDYTLGAEIEGLVLAGFGQAGTGNALANTIQGSDGNDTIDGAGGADSAMGGLGDDTYYVDSAADRVGELAGEGDDTVYASVNYALSAGSAVETLVLTGTAHQATGNELANRLVGTAGDDSLDGGAGADTLDGGAGNDTYAVDNGADVVVEVAGGGIDRVIASVDYALAEGSAVENLSLAGSAHHATGNSADNAIDGGAGDDWLNGGGGNDTLSGGAGNDHYAIDASGATIVEAAGGGTDTVDAAIDFSLAGIANVENLTLTGTAHHATGNDLDNALTGGTGADLLEGGLGNDQLNGGTGADTMDGGAGDDTYYIDNVGDVVVEAAGGGTDTVYISSDWTLADNIENVVLVGSGHTLTGNAANNRLSGDTGDDILDGGAGDDTELGGDGNDVLISSSGRDTLAGGSGDDVYRIHGGSAHIEDFQGHDTIDASAATGDSHIDLSGETQTEIENEICDFGTGGTVTGALNVQFLQDLTGSFADDIANVRVLVPQIVAALQGVSGGAAFGVSSFRDKVYGAFGGAGDWVYRTDAAIGATSAALTAAYTAFVASGGNDEPEAQIEALMQLALRSTSEVGFQNNSARIVVLFTDAHFHTAADGTAAGILTPNNGDAIIDNGGILENYPELAQVKAALDAANVIPIFAVTGGLETTYQSLATALGRGTVVTLTSNSSNIVTAITSGLATATTTHIADAIGGAGNDSLIGNVGANVLTGNAGNDVLTGGLGNDVLHGGEGQDRAVFAGAIGDYTITHNADGSVTVADTRATGNEGTDSLDGIELLTFGGTLYTIAGVAVVAPSAVDDAVSGLVEAGNGTPGNASASGNVLTNDSAPTGGAAVAGVHAGATGSFTAVSGATIVDGIYGTLTINPDGSFSYALDNARAATEALAAGEATTDIFAYQLTDSMGAVAEARISVAITGSADGVPTVVTATADRLLVTAGMASSLQAAVLLANDSVTNGETLQVTSVSNATGGTVALVDGQLVINAGGAGGFDYVATSSTGATATGHVTFATVATGALSDRIATASLYAAADLVGQAGDDVLTGGSGADRLVGGDGNDRLNGGLGADSLIGGLGNDNYTVDNAGDVVIEAIGEGTDKVTATISYTLGANLERLTLAGIADLDGTGNELANLITGNAGANRLYGLDGNDTITSDGGNDLLDGGLGDDSLSGGDGIDTLIGGDGNDRLNGGLHADSMAGGLGNDVYTVDDAGDVVTEAANEGVDTVTATVSHTLGANVEKLTLSGTADLDGTGNELANTLTGNAGANSLFGLGGNDILAGGLGNDFLSGDGGRDNLSGGEGDDILSGGAGADILTGGLGSDGFRFDVLEIAANRDTIRDFEHGVDHLLIDRSVFTAFAGYAPGALGSAEIAFGTAATTPDQHLIYNQATGALYYDADGVGGAAQVQIATLANFAALGSGDFLLV